MDSKKLTAGNIWQKYEKDCTYKNSLKLFDKVKKQEKFFIGEQWDGVNAPDLPKPVINVVKRVTNYLISVLIVDDIGISIRGFLPKSLDNLEKSDGSVLLEDILPKEIERILENTKFRSKTRFFLKDAAITGGACAYSRFDVDSGKVKEGANQPTAGEIVTEIVSITNLHLGNTLTSEIEAQPYVIISKSVPTAELKEQYPEAAENITADDDHYNIVPEENKDDVSTVLIFMRKIKGTVHVTVSTENVILEEEHDTGLTLYPVSFFNWESVKNHCHGVGVVEEVIPNQIVINKLWALAVLFETNNGFPKVIIDKTKVERWDNNPNSVIGVIGNPNDAIASSFRAYDMSSQIVNLVNQTISFTKEFMGANDAVLGNVNPDNTSAIIAMQKASAAPLELQRLSFHQFIEDHVRILIDIIRNQYGIRYVYDGEVVKAVDFSEMDYNSDISVDIGASSAWSETAQVQTMDKLFTSGIVTDAITYVESIPEKLLPNKKAILNQLKEQRDSIQQQMLPAGGMIDEMQMQ